jgi:hypothetical protein
MWCGAGHYVPTLVQEVVNYNKHPNAYHLNLKGFAVKLITKPKPINVLESRQGFGQIGIGHTLVLIAVRSCTIQNIPFRISKAG